MIVTRQPIPKRQPAVPVIAAHPLEQRQTPFDGPDWLFEMKYDGYRGLVLSRTGEKPD
jgi:ATP-dependent DNA ligase